MKREKIVTYWFALALAASTFSSYGQCICPQCVAEQAALVVHHKTQIVEETGWWVGAKKIFTSMTSTGKYILDASRTLKDVVKTTASTVSDIKNFEQQLLDDKKGLRSFSEAQASRWREYWNIRDVWAKGPGSYKSLMNLSDWYEKEMNFYKDSEGKINGLTTFSNVTTGQYLQQSIRIANVQAQLVTFQRNSTNPVIKQLLLESRDDEKEASLLNRKLQFLILGKSLEDLGSVFKTPARNISYTDFEVTETVARIEALITSANEKKRRATTMMYEEIAFNNATPVHLRRQRAFELVLQQRALKEQANRTRAAERLRNR